MNDEESDRLYMSDPKAKSIGAFIEALTILARYVEGGVEKKHFSGAEHDVFYAGGDGPVEDSEDGRRLLSLGWHYEDETESWAYYT